MRLLRIMRRRGHCAPDARSYLSALRACARAARWEPALELLEEMKQQLSSSDDDDDAAPAPDARCYTAAIEACGAAKQCAPALALFDEMRAAPGGGEQDGRGRGEGGDGIEPNVVSYSVAIAACAAAAADDAADAATAASPAARRDCPWAARALELLDEMRARSVKPVKARSEATEMSWRVRISAETHTTKEPF